MEDKTKCFKCGSTDDVKGIIICDSANNGFEVCVRKVEENMSYTLLLCSKCYLHSNDVADILSIPKGIFQ